MATTPHSPQEYLAELLPLGLWLSLHAQRRAESTRRADRALPSGRSQKFGQAVHGA